MVTDGVVGVFSDAKPSGESSLGDPASEAPLSPELAQLIRRAKALMDDETGAAELIRFFHDLARASAEIARMTDAQLEGLIKKHFAAQVPPEGLAMMSAPLRQMIAAFCGTAGGGKDAFNELIAKPGVTSNEWLLPLMNWGRQDFAGMQDRLLGAMDEEPPPAWIVEGLGMGLLKGLNEAQFRRAVASAERISDSKMRQRLVQVLKENVDGFYTKPKDMWDAAGERAVKSLCHQASLSPSEREEALSQVLEGRLRQESPAETIAWVEQLDLPTDFSLEASRALADAWAVKDRAAAATWWLARGTEAERSMKTERVIEGWTRATMQPDVRRRLTDPDRAAAAEWLTTQPDAGSDRAKATLAESWLFYDEPVAALEWSSTIRDTALREETQKRLRRGIALREAR